MDRRAFLTRGPAAMAALVIGGTPRDEASPKRQKILALLDKAERLHVQAHELVHLPWRYHEARLPLLTLTEAAAEAWLRDRGIESRSQLPHSWFFVACGRPDEITGIAWRGMHLALCEVERYCDPLGSMAKRKDFTGQTRATLQTRARAALVAALNTAALCIEGVRREAVHRVPVGGPAIPPSKKSRCGDLV